MKSKSVIKKRLWTKFKAKQRDKNIVRIVKREVARNVENKNTATLSYRSAIGGGTGIGVNWYLFNNFHTLAFGGQGIFNITRGTQDNHRIGSTIKLKRWIIKGHISPMAGGNVIDEAAYLGNSYQGYVDIYFGKRQDGGILDKALPAFLNNGATSEQPTGADTQIFHTVNKYRYKVYYHKRFKVGSSAGSLNTLGTSFSMVPNNEYKLTHTFGFDVTKYILKNRIIKFDDQTDIPLDTNIQTLGLWARFTPAVGSLGSLANKLTYYTVMCQTYAEYEDA